MESLASIAQIIGDVATGATADKLSEAGMTLVRARDEIREALQNETAKAMKPIIHKLEKQQPLTPEEKDLIRLWIVGDAEAFTKKENDYQQWLEEFRQLGVAIGNKGAGQPASLQEMQDLYGNLEEAVRLAGDLQFFLQEKERLARFQQAIQNLSASEAELLANILQEKLTSPEM
jgi:hypothetical protein